MANLMSPRKAMAGGGGGGNFGIPSTPGGVPSVSNSNRGMKHTPQPESARHPPIARGGKKLPGQRHPDHGPHSY